MTTGTSLKEKISQCRANLCFLTLALLFARLLHMKYICFKPEVLTIIFAVVSSIIVMDETFEFLPSRILGCQDILG
jgi:hypothetical protein